MEVKSVEMVSMIDVQQTEKILKCLWFLFIVHGQNEIQVRFIIHFFLIGHALLEYTLNENPRQRASSESENYI